MKYLSNSSENLFQRIKRYVTEYESIHGENSSVNIGVGEPDGFPPETVRKLVAKYVMERSNKVHTYWDNRDPNRFCRNFALRTVGVDIDKYSHISSLVLPGEKSVLGLLPIACGANTDTKNIPNKGFVRTAPAYDQVGQWAEYLGEESAVWPLYSCHEFRLNIENLPKTEYKPRMIITVKPGNPCPKGASRNEWEELIAYCITHNIRLVNDGAYSSLVHTNHVSLAEVAVDYPELDWIEFYSISKAISACGWRLGAAVGSNDFIDELTKVKGNSDSGPFGPGLLGCEEYFSMEESKIEMSEIQMIYKNRLDVALPLFKKYGFKKACETDAGFFMLFHCPKKINGEEMKDSESFNKKMIALTGIVGVPFSGAETDGVQEQFIRYSVCSDFTDEKMYKKVTQAFDSVSIEY